MLFFLSLACSMPLVVPDGGTIQLHVERLSTWDGEVVAGEACAFDASGLPVLGGTRLWLTADGVRFGDGEDDRTTVQLPCVDRDDQPVACDAAEATVRPSDPCAGFSLTPHPGAGTVELKVSSGAVVSDVKSIAVRDTPDHVVLRSWPADAAAEGGSLSLDVLALRTDGQPATGVWVELTEAADWLDPVGDAFRQTDETGKVQFTVELEANETEEARVADLYVQAFGPEGPTEALAEEASLQQAAPEVTTEGDAGDTGAESGEGGAR